MCTYVLSKMSNYTEPGHIKPEVFLWNITGIKFLFCFDIYVVEPVEVCS